MRIPLRIFLILSGLILSLGFSQKHISGIEHQPKQNQQDPGKVLFMTYCCPCHGVRLPIVGPALAYIDKRRERKWLYAFTCSNTDLMMAGDPYATYLYCKTWPGKWSPMPNYTFTHHQLDQLYSFIDAESVRLKLPFVDDHLKETVDSCVLYKQLRDSLTKAHKPLDSIKQLRPRDYHYACSFDPHEFTIDTFKVKN